MPEPIPERSDAELIASWRAGDETAASELMRRHARPVARFLSASGAGDDLEDLLQEAFFRAFRHIERFQGASGFRTWVMAIARNAWKDLRRRRRRRPMLPLDDREVPDGSGDPHARFMERDLEQRLGREVTQLPPMQRNVFLLRAQQGLPYGEIAQALETSEGAARVHYHQAVKRLKQALQD